MKSYRNKKIIYKGKKLTKASLFSFVMNTNLTTNAIKVLLSLIERGEYSTPVSWTKIAQYTDILLNTIVNRCIPELKEKGYLVEQSEDIWEANITGSSPFATPKRKGLPNYHKSIPETKVEEIEEVHDEKTDDAEMPQDITILGDTTPFEEKTSDYLEDTSDYLGSVEDLLFNKGRSYKAESEKFLRQRKEERRIKEMALKELSAGSDSATFFDFFGEEKEKNKNTFQTERFVGMANIDTL